MTIEADYVRLIEGNSHKEREELRLSVLKTRIDSAKQLFTNLDTKDNSQVCVSVINDLEKLISQIEDLQQTIVSTSCENLKETILQDYPLLKDKVREVRNIKIRCWSRSKLPREGDPNSSSRSISNLYCRFAMQTHYAQGDSRVHIAEKVM